MARFYRWGVFFCIGLLLSLMLISCNRSASTDTLTRLTIGVVTYGSEDNTLDRYARFKDYLAERLQAVIELEPAFNELQAVEQIQRQNWSLVFASSGLVAIAIDEAQYVPIFPIQGPANLRSVIVTPSEGNIETLADLFDQPVALGEPGSATGYYLPLYDLYGLTLAEIRFAPTPKSVLDWIQSGEVAAGALSATDYERYRSEFPGLKVIHESRIVPPGAVLLGPTVDRTLQQLIETAMREAPSSLVADAGYLPKAQLPKFDQLVELVNKVRPLEQKVRQQPAVLTVDE